MIYANLSKHIKETADRLESISADPMSCTLNGYALKTRVTKLIDLLRTAMYPKIYSTEPADPRFSGTLVINNLQQAAILLYEMLCDVMCENRSIQGKAEDITADFIASLPDIAEVLKTDVQAAYEGDPAAKCAEEIMLSYPAFNAISIYRLAHRLTELGVPLLPRMMTEYAHQMTGIDIHPGAAIGPYFFIDHGTGVVIGETCVIGRRVKLYQGVTLGAKSFEADEDGNPVKGIKRHPNIGNNVVIYSGATILGGDTTVGDNCVVGGNVWLTHSVDPGRILYYDGLSYQK